MLRGAMDICIDVWRVTYRAATHLKTVYALVRLLTTPCKDIFYAETKRREEKYNIINRADFIDERHLICKLIK